MTPQKKLFGITVTDDSTFVCATVVRGSQGWRKGAVRRWASDSPIRNYLLLHRRVNLALPGRWVRRSIEDSDDILAVQTEQSFSVLTGQSEYDLFSGLLRNNLRSTFPEDAALAMLPIHFRKNCRQSYITLCNDRNSIRTGIIIDGQIIFALSCRCGNADHLKGHFERLRYYCTNSLSLPSFPDTVYTLNTLPFSIPEAQRIECGSDDPAELKAMGAAVASEEQSISLPRFGEAYPEAKLSGIRLALLATALLLFLATAVFSTIFAVHNVLLGRNVAAASGAYHDLLDNNVAIKQLIATGDSLSRKVLKINSRRTNPSMWGPFLHMLGTKRPEGLYLERLGSEPVPGDGTKNRIALGGWCKTETVATDFIKVLSASPLLGNVTLSSMERVGKEQYSCRFKIVCILSIKRK